MGTAEIKIPRGTSGRGPILNPAVSHSFRAGSGQWSSLEFGSRSSLHGNLGAHWGSYSSSPGLNPPARGRRSDGAPPALVGPPRPGDGPAG